MLCALALAVPQLVNAQTVNQYIVTPATYPTTFAFQITDFDLGPNVYASSGLPLTYTSSNPAVATIVGNKIHAVSVGSFVLTLSQAGDATFKAAPDLVVPITIVQGFQTITFPQPPAKSLTDGDFDPGATSTSGLPVIYTSSTPTVATIVAGKIHIVSTGSATITASHPGNANYRPANTESRTFFVSSNTQTITFAPINKAFHDVSFTPTATASSGLPISYYTSSNPAVATVINSTTIQINGIGTSTITATQLGGPTYQAVSASTTLTVSKANQTIFISSTAGKSYGSADYDPLAVASSGLPVSYISSNTAVATIIGNNIHITGVGTTTITASQAGNATYNASPNVTQTLIITKGAQAITFPEIAARSVAAPDFNPGAITSSGLTVTYTSSNPAVATIVGNQVDVIGLGTTIITAAQAGDANYDAAASVSKSFTVSGSSQIITFPPIATKSMGDADFNPGASANTGLAITYTSDNPAVATIVANKIHLTGPGTAQITATQLGNATYVSASATTTLTVNKATQTISFGPILAKLRSDADFDPAAIASSGLAIIYASNNPAVATIVANKIHLLSAGTAVITASQGGNAVFDPALDVTQNLTVNKGVQVITFPSIPPKTLADIDFDPGATSNSGLHTVYTSSNPAVATIVAGKVSIVGAGNSIITASQAGDANYLPTSISRTLTVAAMTQVITFPPIPNVSLGAPDFDPGATTNSGLTITYTSSNPLVATIVANKIQVVGAGTTNIVASQAGDGVYSPAVNSTRTLTVQKILQVITFPNIPVKTVGDADFGTGASSTSVLPITYVSSNPAVATVGAGTIHIVSAGTTTIVASQAGDATHEPALNVSRLLTVNGSIAQTITFNPIPDKTFGTGDFDAGAASNSGLPVTYTSSNLAVATIVNNNVHIIGVGTTTITATQAGSVDYTSAVASTTLNVIKGTPTLSFPSIPAKIVNNVDFDLFVTTNSGLPITYSSSNLAVATIVGTKVHPVGAGTSTITASIVGNANYNPISATQLLTISKGFQVINFPIILNAMPSAADFAPGATINSGLTITYTSSNPAVATIVGGNIHIVGVGTTNITASQAGNADYDAAPNVIRTLTVGKAFQSITFSTIPVKALSDPDFDPATATSGLTVTYTSSNLAVATIVAGKIHIVGVGTTLITASQTGDINYSPAADAARTLTVGGTAQSITFAGTFSKVYGTPDFTPDAVASSGLELTYTSSNPLVATIVDNKVRITGVGSAIITALQFGNSTYSSATAVSNMIVTKASQTISIAPTVTKLRSDADFNPGAIASSGLTVIYASSNPAVASIVSNKVHIEGAGIALIIASQPGNANYTAANTVTQELTVLKGTQLINFPDIPAKAQTDADFNPGASVNSGLVITYTSSNPAVATIVAGKIHIVGLGTSVITASQSGDINYNAAVNVDKTLTVSGTGQIITFAPIPNKKLQDPDFDLVATVNTGLPLTYASSNSAVATVVGNKVHITGAGTTLITAHQAGDAIYAATSVSVTLTVDQNAQIITFPAISAKDLASPDFDPGATASSGLIVTYTSADSTIATIVAGKVHIVGAGATTITASQVGNANFAAATTVSMALVVNRTAQTITFPDFAVKNYNDADFDLTATSTSGLPITYVSGNTSIATILGNKVHIVAAGTVAITASQAGNSNYTAATDVAKNLSIVFALPVNNFSVKAIDETCKTSNNGAINITATQSLNYTATIIGVNGTTTHPFNTTLAVNNLQAGTYNVCVTIAEQPSYKQCFDLVVKEPKDLAVYSSLKNDGNTVVLRLEGSDLYRIELNGQIITTTDQEISLPLVKGNNLVKISSDKTCQGVIERTFITTNSISLYPNPIKNILNITTGSNESSPVKIDIHALDGRLMHSSQHRAEYGRVGVDLSKLNKGLYVLTLTIGNTKTVHKILKD